MVRTYRKKEHVKVLVVLSILFFILSIIIHRTGVFGAYRGIRGLSSIALIGVLIYYKKKDLRWPVASFLFLYGISSLATIWYENQSIASISLALNFFSFMVLIGALSPKINFKKMNFFFAAIFGILVLVNAYLLYTFVEMIRGYAHGDIHYFLMMIGAMSLVVTGFLSLLYNHQFSSKTSLLLTISVFVIVFSEVFRAIGYYNFAYGDLSVYIARALLLLGTALLVHFELTEKKKDEELGRNISNHLR